VNKATGFKPDWGYYGAGVADETTDFRNMTDYSECNLTRLELDQRLSWRTLVTVVLLLLLLLH
jgi:hypothetical protein